MESEEEDEKMESSSLPPSPSSQTANVHTHHTPTPSYGLSLPLSADVSQGQAGAAEAVGVYLSPCSPQISLSEYNAQAGDFTQQALRELKASPEYKRHLQRCRSCGASWFDGVWSEGCPECGEGAMERECCICRGKCGKRWRRNVEMSHSMHTAHWDGECGHKAAAAMLKDMLQLAGVMDAMEDLDMT